MKTTKLCVCLFLVLSLFACKQDDESLDRASIYIGCCDIEPSVFISSNGSAYIPNAFTPNGDGINDLFEVSTVNIDFVPRFEIKDQNDEVVFSLLNFSAYFNTITWDGTVNHFGNDAIVGGLYTYEIEFFTIYGENKKLSGSVCAFLCDEAFPEDMENCLFTTQVNENGFDPAIGAQEGNCFN